MFPLTLGFDGREEYGARASLLTAAQIPLVVALHRGEATTGGVQAVLDTGASRCFFGPGLAQQLGIDLDTGGGRWETALTANGPFRFQVHSVVIELPSWCAADGTTVAYEVAAAFCDWGAPHYDAKAILGLHGFFDRFCIAIHEQQQSLWWRYCP